MRDMMESAQDVDEDLTPPNRLHLIRKEAIKHGCRARIVAGTNDNVRVHVLVTNDAGEVLATRSAVRLAKWLGY